MNNDDLINGIDNILPQTQCDLCGYGGCKPYATAMVKDNAPIDKCPPGGIDTLKRLSEFMQKPYADRLVSFMATIKKPSTAVIREAECIGCTKCITACPVDAIIGSAKHMHTIITDECTGCDLCIPACPVDCIDSIPLETPRYTKAKAKARFEAKQIRLKQEKDERRVAFNEKKELAKSDYMANLLKRTKGNL